MRVSARTRAGAPTKGRAANATRSIGKKYPLANRKFVVGTADLSPSQSLAVKAVQLLTATDTLRIAYAEGEYCGQPATTWSLAFGI